MKQHQIVSILKWATFSVFAARGFQHIYWDAPYRTLFWDENLMKGLVTNWLGYDWHTYVTSPATDAFLTSMVDGIGWFYLLCALAALFIQRLPRVAIPILLTGSLSLLFLAFLYCKEHFFFVGQFFEYTLQWSAPVFLVLAYRQILQPSTLSLSLKIAIALTFTCHGLYAVGYYPRPGHFMQMTMNILHIDKASAIQFLNVAGALDFVLSVLIFLPGRLALLGLGYAIFWGFGTTMARIYANFIPDFWQDSLLIWTHETLMRFPHFLVPLAVFLMERVREQVPFSFSFRIGKRSPVVK